MNPLYPSDYRFRRVYLLTCAADDAAETPERALNGLQGWIDCFPKAELAVLWEDNESVNALKALAAETPLTIQLSPYGGFEQVGPIGQSLPRQDAQTTTAPGDIVLYAGSQLIVFYGSNSWSYTRLGHITTPDAAALTALLGNGSVTLTVTPSPD